MSVRRYCAVLFAVGAVALAGSVLQAVVHSKAIGALDQAAMEQSSEDKDFWNQMPQASISAPVLVRLTIAVTSISLLFTTLFMALDLSGHILLRHRAGWNTPAMYDGSCGGCSGFPDKLCSWDTCGKGWRSPTTAERQQRSKGAHKYNIFTERQRIAWWRRWAAVEELVVGVQRNVACIRLVISVILALVWSPIAVQMSVVSLTGRCRAAVRSSHHETSMLEACALLRKGMIGVALTWLCWTVLAVILVLLNTSSRRSQPRYYYPAVHQHAGCVPLSAISGGCSAGLASSSSGAKNSNAQSSQNPFLQPQYHQVFQNPYAHSAGGAGQKKATGASTHARSSWSNIDEESIAEAAAKGSIQSLVQAHRKSGFYLQPQSLLHHPMFHHQLHGLHQFQPSARASQEKAQRQNFHQKMHKKRVPSMLRRSLNSSASGIAEQPLLNLDASAEDGAAADDSDGIEAGQKSADGRNKNSNGANNEQEQAQARSKQSRSSSLHGPMLGDKRTTRSLASFSCEDHGIGASGSGKGRGVRSSAASSKRNTIG